MRNRKEFFISCCRTLVAFTKQPPGSLGFPMSRDFADPGDTGLTHGGMGIETAGDGAGDECLALLGQQFQEAFLLRHQGIQPRHLRVEVVCDGVLSFPLRHRHRHVTDEIPFGSGILDPKVDASTASMNTDERQTSRRNRGSIEWGSITRASVVQRPGNSATQAFARYGRSFPKSTSPLSKLLLRDSLSSAAEEVNPLPAVTSSTSLPVHDSIFSRPIYGCASLLPVLRERRSGYEVFESFRWKRDPGLVRHPATSRNNRMSSASAFFRSASISSSGLGACTRRSAG